MSKKLKNIVLSAPIAFPISRNLQYAGTERVVDYLNQGYSTMGINSHVFAPGDSDLSGYGTLVPTLPESVWKIVDGKRINKAFLEEYKIHYDKILQFARNNPVDIIHDNPGKYLILSDSFDEFSSSTGIPVVTTIHGGHITGERNERLAMLMDKKKKGYPVYFVSLSNSHKKVHEKHSNLMFDEIVYNGIPTENFTYKENKQDFLFWIGRIISEKGTDLAIDVAKKTGLPLVIAGEPHEKFKSFFDERISPNLDYSSFDLSTNAQQIKVEDYIVELQQGNNPFKEGGVYFIGLVNDRQKDVFYSNALATLIPNRWDEPFGLITVESMVTGTPVLVTGKGSLPELVEDGVTGYVVNPFSSDSVYNDSQVISGFVEGIKNIDRIKPADCRKHVIENFSMEAMANSYVKFFERILNGKI